MLIVWVSFNTENSFIEIFLPKSKLVLISILYRSPNKYYFVNCIERTFSNNNVFESQECYLLGDININLQPKDKEIFRQKFTYLTRSYLEFCSTKFLRTNNDKANQGPWSNCNPYWSYTYKLTWQSQSVRHHRSWSIWSWPDLLHKKDIPTQIT